MIFRPRLTLALLLLMLGSPALGQTTQESPRKGTYDISFDQRSPLSSFEVQHARYGVERNHANLYETAQETITVFVPDEYDGSTGWGVLVWSNPGGGGGGPRDWSELLAKKKLIWVAAHNAGNNRAVGVRIGLALDAVFNLRKRYTLDEHRTYIGGVSGGAKVAQMTAMAFPEVFDGAISSVGASWYRDIPVPDRPNTFWPATFGRPPAGILSQARDDVGFILITGDRDPNHDPMKAIYDSGFVPEGFKHVVFHDVPGMGHSAPSLENLEKAIDELDALPKDRVKKLPTTRPRAAVAASQRATPATRSAAPRTAEVSEASKLMSLARTYRSNGMQDKARARLEQLVREYPESEEAKLAQTMLRQMGGR